MRRLGMGLAVIGLVAGSLGSASAGPGVGAEHVQWIHADWIDMKGDKGTFVAAAGFRFVDAVEPGTFGMVAKGMCRRTRGDNFTMIMCQGKGVAKAIPIQDLEMHPLMESASLRVRAAGFNNRVSWDGRGDAPIIAEQVVTGDSWAAAGAFMDRDAKTRGKVYGKSHKTNGWLDWGFMTSYVAAGASVGAELQTDGLTIDLKPNGTVLVERTIRIPH